jgi:hypothetical protein
MILDYTIALEIYMSTILKKRDQNIILSGFQTSVIIHYARYLQTKENSLSISVIKL